MAGDMKGKDTGKPKTTHRLHHTVLGVFGSLDQAERALRALHEAGFSRKDLSLVAQGTEAADEIRSQAQSEHATHGAERGAIIGGVLGGLVGVAALAIPGVGPVITAGWLAAVLGGAAVGAAAGGLVGAMAEMGVPKEVAQRYAQQVAHGDLLVIAHPHDEQGEVTANAVDGLTTTQAARRLGVSAVRIHQILRAGQLRYMETSLGRLINPADLERLAAERERTRRKKEG